MKQYWKKSLALLLSLVMCISLLPMTQLVHAEDAEEAAGETSTSYEPWGHGYRMVDVLNWDPATDPYSEELVASVPLQERNATYAPTQANPELTDKAELYAISSSNYRSTDVNEAPWNAGMSYDDFTYNAFKFWQYTDYTGAGGRPTQDIAVGSAEKEYGIIAIPMAAATNAAHKNGVKSLAEYFTPRNPQYTEEWLQKDENGEFPYAQKLLDIMDYYGFDGYFINQEEAIPAEYVPVMKEMLAWMVEKGAYIQWYDSMTTSGTISYQNQFNSVNASFVQDETYGRVSNSIFLNYWYDPGYLKDSAAYAESLNLDPYETVFMGLEGGEWRFSQDLEDFTDIMYNHNQYCGNLMQEDGQPYTSLAIWGSDFYREQYNKAEGNRYKVEYQWEAEERERMYFTSPSEQAGNYTNGADEGSTIDRSDVGVAQDELNFRGISRYVVEKSVINGTTFATDFNNGHGMVYYVNGEVSRDMQWTNLNLQDILPTWQWWIEAEDVTLDMDWDYGPKFTRVQNDGQFDYTQIGAYNGGSSLVIYGSLKDAQLVNLYKTELDVTGTSALKLTYNKPVADDSSVIKVAITLAVDDKTTRTEYLTIEDSGKKTDGWTTVTVDLSAYAGETIAAIGLELSATEQVEAYQLNLGRLVITDGADYTPAAPSNVTLAKRFDETGEIQLTWDLADYDDVINYHIYAVYGDGTTRFVGGAYASNYYIQTLENAENVVALEVHAVGIDGSESEGVQVALTSAGRVSDIRTTSEGNALTVTWTEPSGIAEVEVAVDYWYSAKEAPEAVTVDAGTGKAVFGIDREDGEKYILSVTTINADGTRNETVNYFGELADTYSDPYDGEARLQADGLYDLTVPANSDWYTMDVNINGSTTTYKRIDGSKLQNIAVPSEGVATMVLTVTDKDGNVSEPVTKVFEDGIEVDKEGGYGANLIPDPVLRRALQELVGDTLQDLIDFKETLDLTDRNVTNLTGLNLLTSLTGLNLTGTGITTLVSSDIPSTVAAITIADCGSLVSIELDNRPDTALVLGDLPKLTTLSAEGYGNHALNLTGSPNLENLYLSNALLKTLNIKSNTKLDNFLIDGSQIATLTHAGASAYTSAYYWVWDNARMDLTGGTYEGKLMNGMKRYFASTELEERMDPAITTLYCYNGYYATGNRDAELVMDLGWVHELTSVSWNNSYNDVNPANYYFRYNILEATISVSDDAETWTEVAHYVCDDWTMENCADYDHITVELPEGTRGRYVKLATVDVNKGDLYYGDTLLRDGYPYVDTICIDGHFIAYTGFTYAGQQPAVKHKNISTASVIADGANFQTLDLLDEYYASAYLSRSGSKLRTIEGADWIDAAYLTEEAYAPAGVRVTITDENGETYVHPDDTLGTTGETKLAVNTDAVFANGQNNNEEGFRLFDGLSSTKWCTSGNGSWCGFELTEPAILAEWYTLHAGNEGFAYITSDFRLQYLNPEKVTEEDYLAMDADGKKAVQANESNWLDLDVIAGNTDNEVSHEIDMTKLVCAQVYRLKVDKCQQYEQWGWAVRILEMELYGFTGTLDCVTNGLLKADTEGTYTVTYCVNKTPINSTTVNVTAPTAGDVIERIAAIGTPITSESAEAIRLARTAYDNLSDEEKALVTNYDVLVAAEADYWALADQVEALIDKIGTVTEDSGADIEAAIAAYEALNEELKAEVKNADALFDAAGAYAQLVLSDVDTGKINHVQKDAVEAILAQAQADVESAQSAAEIMEILSDALADIEAAGELKCAAEIFTDVDEDSWFHEDVDLLYNAGYMVGTSATTFGSADNLTREQVVAILYRIAGSPSVEGQSCTFTDVNPDAYYANAVIWGSNNGIVFGYNATTFGVGDEVTREQLVAFLYRYAGSPAVDGDLTEFPDADTISEYAVPAMTWAVENGIVVGAVKDGKTVINPEGTAIRAQAAAIFARYLRLI